MSQKKLVAFAAILLMACTNNESTETKPAGESATSINMYGYAPNYSANFEMGSAASKEKVLSLYRAWDDNTLDNVMDVFADSLYMYTWDGGQFVGPKDSIMSMMKQYRGSFASIKSDVNALVGVKEPEKNEEWVLVWFNETRTDKEGKVDSTQMQETWGLDPNGKVKIFYQYGQKNAEPEKK